MTHEFKLKAKPGRIAAFNRRTATGVVTIGRKTYPFGVTSYRSGGHVRYPALGERVEAVFSDDGSRLVSVWATER